MKRVNRIRPGLPMSLPKSSALGANGSSMSHVRRSACLCSTLRFFQQTAKTRRAAVPRLRGLRFDEQHCDVGVRVSDRRLDAIDARFDVRGRQGIFESYTESSQDLVGAELNGKHAVRSTGPRIAATPWTRLGGCQHEECNDEKGGSRTSQPAAPGWRLVTNRLAYKRCLRHRSGSGGVEGRWRSSDHRSRHQTRDRVSDEDSARRRFVVREKPCDPVPALFRERISSWARPVDLSSGD